MQGKQPVAINLDVCDPEQYALQGCDLSELRILKTHDVAPDVWGQAPHLLWIRCLGPLLRTGMETCSCHKRHTASEDMWPISHSILQELVLLELWCGRFVVS